MMKYKLRKNLKESTAPVSGAVVCSPSLLDLFCGVGGWTKAFIAMGWRCVGVDIEDHGYPGELWKGDVRELDQGQLNSFDAIVSSPPCEEFARAWLPWLRGDQRPSQDAIDLLQWSVDLCEKPNRITECSYFASKHVAGGQRFGSYVLWGDVPILMPILPRRKMAKSGMKPATRAEIPIELAEWIAKQFTAKLKA